MGTRLAIAAAATGAGLLVTSAYSLATAGTLPPASYSLSAQAGSENPADDPLQILSTSGTVNSNGSSVNGNAFSSAYASPTPDPSVAASGEIGAGPFGIATASASLDYYFQVVGPSANVLVPVDITGQIVTNMTAFAGDNGGYGTDLESDGDLQIVSNDVAHLTNGNQEFAPTSPCNENGGGCGVLSVNTSIQVLSSNGGASDPAASSVYLYAAISGVSQPDGGNAQASVDPTLVIDPTFLAANPGYSLVFSQGIGDVPVPLPTSAWLLGSALGLLGLFGARRLAPHGIAV